MPYVDPAKVPTQRATGQSAVVISPACTGSADCVPNPNNGNEGDFREPCNISHFAFDDPLVLPGQPGKSHLHAFYGNTGVNAYSTNDTINNSGNSTCAGGTANRTGYWFPAMIDTKDGTPIVPVDVKTYYKSGPHLGRDVQQIPAGLRMIAGNSAATTAAQASGRAFFQCVGSGNKGQTVNFGCPAGQQLWAEIEFPTCWDGVNLDSPDHKGHMAYAIGDPSAPSGNVCPSTHPVKMPAITIIAVYDIPDSGALARWRLSSDNYDPKTGSGGYSLHADWWNGWMPSVVKTWTTHCLNKQADCHAFLLGDGTALY